MACPHGEPHVNEAGRELKSWLAERNLCAVSTHFKNRRGRGEGRGTWRHPRSKKLYQNDHVFVVRGVLPRVNNCRRQEPLCRSDHLAVKATTRACVKLAQKAPPSDPEAIKARNHLVSRPFTPRFDARELTEVAGGIGDCTIRKFSV